MKGRAHVRYRCCAALRTTRPASNAMVLLLTVVVLTGCVHHYKITLNSGTQIESAGKPRLENGYYYYKDSSGRKAWISAGRVREIAPASMAKDDNAAFKAMPAKPAK